MAESSPGVVAMVSGKLPGPWFHCAVSMVMDMGREGGSWPLNSRNDESVGERTNGVVEAEMEESLAGGDGWSACKAVKVKVGEAALKDIDGREGDEYEEGEETRNWSAGILVAVLVVVV